MILMREWIEAVAGESSAGAGQRWFVRAEATLVVAAIGVVTWGFQWARRRGLSWEEAARILFGATTPSAGWSTPIVRRLLLTPAHGVRPPDRDDAADHRRAISDVAARLSAPHVELGATACAAATRVTKALEACDAELAWLETHAGAAAIDRLSAQLDALASVVTRNPETEELTELLEREREVVRRMGVRKDGLAQRRVQLFTLLRGLWTHLSIVRDAEDESRPAPASALTDLHALCREITILVDTDA
jgi:hypothetical protein